jgi:hypothetical protein
MSGKKYTLVFVIAVMLFSAGCNGVVFKTLIDGMGDNIPPTVVSVISTAYNQIRVEYSEDIDPATGTSTSNYQVTGLSITNAALTSNPKVVRLTTDTQLHQTYNIVIKQPIQDLNENQMESQYSGTFQGAVEEPRIVNVTGVKVNQVLVEFSEAVEDNAAADLPASYEIHPVLTVTAVDFPYSGDSTFALLTLGSEMQDTNFTLEIVGDIQDLASYSMHPLYKERSFGGDSRPRIERISSTAADVIMIQFSEDVNIDDVSVSDDTGPDYLGDDVRIQNLDTPGYLNVTGVALDPGDASKLIVTTAGNQTTGDKYKVILKGGTDGVKDSTLNIATFSFTGDYVEDGNSGYFFGDGPLTIVSVETAGPTRLIVTFSEEILDTDGPNANTAANFSIPGLSEPVLTASWPYQSDKSMVELTTPTQLQQIYTLIVDVGFYNFHSQDFIAPDPNRDTLQVGYNTFSFQGDGIPTVSSAFSLDPSHVKVIFSESVDITTAQVVSNYSITAAGYPSLSVTGASRNPDPNSNEVVLETSTQLYVNYIVTVTGVKDTTGNTLSTSGGDNQATFAGIGTDNTPPSILSITAPNTNTIRLYFNEAVDETSAETVSNYSLENQSSATITVNNPPVEDEWIVIDVGGGASQITLTAKAAEDTGQKFFSQAGANDEIAYSIVRCINADSSSPVRAYVNGTDVELVSKTYGTAGDISIDDANISNLTVSSSGSAAYEPLGAARSDGNSAQVDLDFSTLSVPHGLYTLQVSGVSDTTLPPNTITSASAVVSVRGTGTDDTLPAHLMGVYAEDASHIRLLFDEPVEFLSANDPSHFTIEREIAEVTIVGSISAAQSLVINSDLGNFTVTATNNTEDIPNGLFSKTDGIDGIVRVLNLNSTSPVYAHGEGNVLKMARRTARSPER